MKLLEEEEKEKREEDERKERRRTKEREKKLRRKERLKGKEKDKDKEKEKGKAEPDPLPEPEPEPVKDSFDLGASAMADANGEDAWGGFSTAKSAKKKTKKGKVRLRVFLLIQFNEKGVPQPTELCARDNNAHS